MNRAGITTAAALELPPHLPLYEQRRRLRIHAAAVGGAGFLDPLHGAVKHLRSAHQDDPSPPGTPVSAHPDPLLAAGSGTAAAAMLPLSPPLRSETPAPPPAVPADVASPLPRVAAARALGVSDLSTVAVSGAPRYAVLGRLFAAAEAGGHDGVTDPITGAVVARHAAPCDPAVPVTPGILAQGDPSDVSSELDYGSCSDTASLDDWSSGASTDSGATS